MENRGSSSGVQLYGAISAAVRKLSGK